jgi:hypothetical protein
MRLAVVHRTVYRYTDPVRYAIQTLRLEPRPYEGMLVRAWSVEGEDRRPLPRFIDGLGNVVHCRTIDRPHREAAIIVTGEVETQRSDGIVLGTVETLPPQFYLRETPLTAPDDAIVTLTDGMSADRDRIECLHALMNRVRDRLDYRPGATDATTTATAALAQGYGVCQDHSHVFIAAAISGPASTTGLTTRATPGLKRMSRGSVGSGSTPPTGFVRPKTMSGSRSDSITMPPRRCAACAAVRPKKVSTSKCTCAAKARNNNLSPRRGEQ